MNMINPANYYNPFAKYNYVSKTRGVYIPKDSEPLLKNIDASIYETKSTSIYSDNYDAEADVLQSMNDYTNGKNIESGNLLGFLDKLFKK